MILSEYCSHVACAAYLQCIAIAHQSYMSFCCIYKHWRKPWPWLIFATVNYFTSLIFMRLAAERERVKVVMSVSQNEDWIEQTLVPQDKTNQGKGTDWRRELKRWKSLDHANDSWKMKCNNIKCEGGAQFQSHHTSLSPNIKQQESTQFGMD